MKSNRPKVVRFFCYRVFRNMLLFFSYYREVLACLQSIKMDYNLRKDGKGDY
jgi:hypothetical protein